jgi:AraC-like DNA-binding protein
MGSALLPSGVKQSARRGHVPSAFNGGVRFGEVAVQASIYIERALSVYLRDQGLVAQARSAEQAKPRSVTARNWTADLTRLVSAAREAYRVSAEPGLALLLGTSLLPQTVPVLGHLFASCPSLRVAISDAQRYIPLLLSDGRYSLSERKGKAHLCFRTCIEDVLVLRFTVELAFSWCVNISRQLIGQRTAPLEVRLPYAAPGHAKTYDSVFGCPVYFDCSAAELVFDARLLDLRQPCWDSHLYRHLQEQAERALKMDKTNSWHERVLDILTYDELAMIEDGTSRVSEQLGISRRALRRYLAKEGQSLARLRDQVRRSLALRLLAETDVSVKEISMRLVAGPERHPSTTG